MEEEPKGFRACLIPIAALIGAGLIGKLLFAIVETSGNVIAIAIMSVLALTFIIFLVRIILGMFEK